ncbi:putative nucleotidyltransferase substrate binding domain-containing protein [Gordonia paraffinivorans]|uniref:putative nucleotidyltransferase substrate binding domain-containing protein n=1 Tax=Gordonia paraffinivorans TaxID=175628 RepID=UPI001447D065|nr:putative nucleotidyltransferase substrate binding domain-containing protein [Gordonia paraffinivorans]
MNGPEDQLTVAHRRDASGTPASRTVADLLRTAPVIGRAEMTVRQAAALMTERGQDYVVIPLAEGRHGLVTDADIRARVVAAGRGADTPVGEIVDGPALVIDHRTSTVDALTELLDRGLRVIPVCDETGRVLGVIGAGDFVADPAGASMPLREQISRSRSVAELQSHARRIPQLVADVVRRDRPAHEVTRVTSLIVDAVVQRGLALVVDSRPGVDPASYMWLSLGSNARREPVLSSDVDSAVVFDDALDPASHTAYREAFAELDEVLRGAGIAVDANGAVASKPLFSRSRSAWQTAIRGWVDEPLENKGMIFTSLILDGRALRTAGTEHVPGDEMIAALRADPRTMRLLLEESLATRARLRTVRDVLTGRAGTFDLKSHALTPLVNIARWAALSVDSAEVNTRARLRAASGSPMLSDDDATTLLEVFDVLQRMRLRYQVARFDRGEAPTDVVEMKRLSPLDRSLVGQAVREIAGVQRRMANMSQYQVNR